MTEGRSLALGVALIAVLVGIVGARFELAADIRHFLPAGNDVRLARVSRLLAEADQARTIVFTVAGADVAEAVDAGRRLEAHLTADPEVEFVLGGLDPARSDALEVLSNLGDRHSAEMLSLLLEDSPIEDKLPFVANSIDRGIASATMIPARRFPSINSSTMMTSMPPSVRLVSTVFSVRPISADRS